MKKLFVLLAFYFGSLAISYILGLQWYSAHWYGFVVGCLYHYLVEPSITPSEAREINSRVTDMENEWHRQYVNNGKVQRINNLLKKGIKKFVMSGDKDDLMDAVYEAEKVE